MQRRQSERKSEEERATIRWRHCCKLEREMLVASKTRNRCGVRWEKLFGAVRDGGGKNEGLMQRRSL